MAAAMAERRASAKAREQRIEQVVFIQYKVVARDSMTLSVYPLPHKSSDQQGSNAQAAAPGRSPWAQPLGAAPGQALCLASHWTTAANPRALRLLMRLLCRRSFPPPNVFCCQSFRIVGAVQQGSCVLFYASQDQRRWPI